MFKESYFQGTDYDKSIYTGDCNPSKGMTAMKCDIITT